MARRRGFKKPLRRKKPKYIVNDKIRVPKVRLVGEDLEAISKAVNKELGPEVYDTDDVKKWADQMGLDVVVISPKAKPPVVKIIDYNKFLYEKKKREKEIKAKTQKTVIKEVRFGPNTDDHDFNFKLNHAKEFLKDGAKLKAYVHFKGRSIVFKDRGELLLLRFIKELEDYGSAEHMPKMEGRRMNVMIAPKKKKKN
ncbi:MAG: translation initiation factor IF-3 [Bacteroidetes bacterium]|nr:translation initiation factor IF-3 [Bacteroidota bacterium]